MDWIVDLQAAVEQAAGAPKLEGPALGVFLHALRGETHFSHRGVESTQAETLALAATSLRSRLEPLLLRLDCELQSDPRLSSKLDPGLQQGLLAYLLNQRRNMAQGGSHHVSLLARLAPDSDWKDPALANEWHHALAQLFPKCGNPLAIQVLNALAAKGDIPWNSAPFTQRLDALFQQLPTTLDAEVGRVVLRWLVDQVGELCPESWLVRKPFIVRYRIAFALLLAGEAVPNAAWGERKTLDLVWKLLSDSDPRIWGLAARTLGRAEPHSLAGQAISDGLRSERFARAIRRRLLAGLCALLANDQSWTRLLDQVIDRAKPYSVHDSAAAAAGLSELAKPFPTQYQHVLLRFLGASFPGCDAAHTNGSFLPPARALDDDRLILLSGIVDSLEETTGPLSSLPAELGAVLDRLLASLDEGSRSGDPHTSLVHRLLAERIRLLLGPSRSSDSEPGLAARIRSLWEANPWATSDSAASLANLLSSTLQETLATVREFTQASNTDSGAIRLDCSKDGTAPRFATAWQATREGVYGQQISPLCRLVAGTDAELTGLSKLADSVVEACFTCWGDPGSPVSPSTALQDVVEARRMLADSELAPERVDAPWADALAFAHSDKPREASAAVKAFRHVSQMSFPLLSEAELDTRFCGLLASDPSAQFWKRLDQFASQTSAHIQEAANRCGKRITQDLIACNGVEDPLSRLLFQCGAFHQSMEPWPLASSVGQFVSLLHQARSPKFGEAVLLPTTVPNAGLTAHPQVRRMVREVRDAAVSLLAADSGTGSATAERAGLLADGLLRCQELLETLWPRDAGNPLSEFLDQAQAFASGFGDAVRDREVRILAADSSWAAEELAQIEASHLGTVPPAGEPARRLLAWWHRRQKEQTAFCRAQLCAARASDAPLTVVRLLSTQMKVLLDLHYWKGRTTPPPPFETIQKWPAVQELSQRLLSAIDSDNGLCSAQRIADLGAEWFQSLPRNLQQALGTRPNSCWLFDHGEQNLALPWELLALPSPEGNRPLAFTHAIGREMRSSEDLESTGRPRHMRGGIAILVGEGVANWQQEVDWIRQAAQLNGWPEPHLILPTPSLSELKQRMAHSCCGILHVIAHGSTCLDRTGEIFISDALHLNGAAFLGLFDQMMPWFVFLNSCQSAVHLLGPSASQSRHACHLQEASVASSLIRSGTPFVGTLHRPEANAASKVARTFYQNLLAGAGLGTALLKARQEAAHEDPVSALGYVLYGDPTLGTPE